MNKLISLSLATFFIVFFFSLSIHPFEVPDENAHFSSINFLYNEGRMPKLTDKDNLSLEELEVEKIFGIEEGQNKYSYHPDYHVEYVSGNIGKYESFIRSLNTPSNRGTYSTYQAATYPPLYYFLTLPFFTLAHNADILTRLFVSRFASVIMSVFIILFAYLIGQEIFAQKKYAITLAVITLFYPMTSYIGAGVNSDNLHNLLFGVATLLALKLIRSGPSRQLLLMIGTVIGLDLITKPQAYILLPIFGLAVVLRWNWAEWKLYLTRSLYMILPLLLLAGWQELPKLILGNSALGVTSYAARQINYGGFDSFKIFLSGYLKTHLTEMTVWYWGVFNWFGVILPRFWWWIATRLLGLSLLGIILKLYLDLRQHTLTWHSKVILFSLGANLMYIGALGWFDWQFYQEFGRSLGLQPRYYMPLLISQLFLMLFGLINLGWSAQSKEWIRRFLIIFFLGLQLTSLYVQLRSYYDLSSLKVFFEQLSQYKPFFAKGNIWYLWFTLYILGVVSITWTVLKSPFKLETKSK